MPKISQQEGKHSEPLDADHRLRPGGGPKQPVGDEPGGKAQHQPGDDAGDHYLEQVSDRERLEDSDPEQGSRHRSRRPRIETRIAASAGASPSKNASVKDLRSRRLALPALENILITSGEGNRPVIGIHRSGYDPPGPN